MPEVFAEFVARDATARKHITATCRTSNSPSSAASSGCCRPATASAPRRAALRIAVDMADEGLITEQEAILRIEPASLDQLLHPTIDPEGRTQDHRDRPAGLARRGHRRDRVHRRRGRGAQGRRPQGHSGARRDLAGGHPRHARGRGHPHHARRHDLPRGGGRARHGQALRLRRRRLCGSIMRPQTMTRHGPHFQARATSSPSTAPAGQVMEGAVPMRAAGTVRRFRGADGLGRRRAPHEGARQRRHAAGRARGARSSAPRASACAAPSTCSSTTTASSRCAR